MELFLASLSFSGNSRKKCSGNLVAKEINPEF